VDEGIRLGVTVTPAFFIYDQLIVGNSLIVGANPSSSSSTFPHHDHLRQACRVFGTHSELAVRISMNPTFPLAGKHQPEERLEFDLRESV
jgi:hypothetical protein